MAGIERINNGVLVDGSPTPYGGHVVGLQYSVSFQSSSTLSVTIANDAGTYDTPELNGEIPLLIEFGSSKMAVLPMSYRKSTGSGGRTLTVNFDDMGVKYLDKTLVLLKHQHLENPISTCDIVLGEMYATDERGVQRRYYGEWKSGIIKVAYDIRDLAESIEKHGIPISQKFLDYLKQFKVYVKENEEPEAPNSFLRTDIGVLRSVLESISTDLGFVAFWNANDGVNDGNHGGVVNNKANEGYLDFIRFENDIDIDIINQTADDVSNSCNIEDDSHEVSIKNSFLKGGIGYFEVNPPLNMGRESHFARFPFKEEIESPFCVQEHDLDGEGTMGIGLLPEYVRIPIKDNYGLELMMRAAQMGPEFYKNYVLQKLCCAYIKEIGSDAVKHNYHTLLERDQTPADLTNAETFKRFSYISRTARVEAAKKFPLNIVENKAVNALYKGPSAKYNKELDEEGNEKGWEKAAPLFDVLPTLYSKPLDQCENWRDTIGKGPFRGKATPPLRDWAGADGRWSNIFTDDSLIDELRETFKLNQYFSAASLNDENKGAMVAPSEFMGIAYRKSKAMFEFLNNPGEDPVFKEVLWLSENYGRWYSMADVVKVKAEEKTGSKADVEADQEVVKEEPEITGGQLITQNVFNTRKYLEDVSWVFSDLAATDTDLADIYKYTLYDVSDAALNEDVDVEWADWRLSVFPRREIEWSKRAKYWMVKAGQSDCGLGLEKAQAEGKVPANVISPDTQILKANGYRCIVGIHRMLNSIPSSRPLDLNDFYRGGANAMPRKTTCAGSIAAEFIISGIYDVQVGPNFKSFALETMVVRSSRLFKNLPSERFELTGLEDVQNVGEDVDKEGESGYSTDRCLEEVAEGEDGAGSIPQSEYSFIQDYRANCTLTLNADGVEIGGIPRPTDESGDTPILFPRKEAEDENGVPISFKYDTDRDFGVILHKHGKDPSVQGEDIEIAYAHYDRGLDVSTNDLWLGLGEVADSEGYVDPHGGSAYMALEVIQIGPKEISISYKNTDTVESPLFDYETYWGPDTENLSPGHEPDTISLSRDIDYWDYKLFADVSLGIKLDNANVKDVKIIPYSFTVEDLLQSIRCSYIPNANFDKIASVSIDPVKFDIGELLEDSSARYEYPICGGGNSVLARLGFQASVGDLDLKTATKNLITIMQAYVDENISPSISRDFVISGFGFKDRAGAAPYLPSIANGLESVSISIGEQGIKTTVKIGNKRRMQASKELRASRVVKGLAGGNAAVTVPNSVQNSFSTALKAKM